MGGSISRILSYPLKEDEAAIDLDLHLHGDTSFLPEEFHQRWMTDNHALLLEIAPAGVYPLNQLPDSRVSSYLTISPLPIYAKATRGKPFYILACLS